MCLSSKYQSLYFKIALAVFCLCVTVSVNAHNINYALENTPVHNVIWFYLKLGIRHIIPLGFDHILFVVGICLISTKMSSILWQATAFTLAHSITLALSMKNIIVAPLAIVEPVISLSIMFVSFENILLRTIKPWRVAIVFLFGLVHGMGFASALNETGLPPGKFYLAIFSFNAGVEVAQIAIIIVVFTLLINPFARKSWYTRFILIPISACIAMVALYWTIDRVAGGIV